MRRPLKKLIPIAIFLTVALASVLAAGYAYRAGEDATRIKFEAAADDAVGRIMVRIEQHISLLRATLAFFEASEEGVSPEAFRTFVSTLEVDERWPGLQGIGFASYLDTGTAEAFIEREFGMPIEVWPQTDQEHRAVITLIEPLDERNRRAIGYDMFSDPTRRAAMIQAIAAGEARSSGRVQLVQEGEGRVQAGFLVYLPFHVETLDPPDALQEGMVRGFVYAPFRAGDLFNAALGRAPLVPVAVEIYDQAIVPERLLFRSETPPAELFGGDYALQRKVEIAGREWIMRFQPTSAFAAPGSLVIPISIALFGLVLATALALGARFQGRAYEAATLLHRSSQKSLLEKDLMLQEMKHRIKNSIARVLAIARQTAAGSKTIDEFSASFGARLQAMAASQDMLTRSSWQKADLGELIRIELEQVLGQNLDLENLQGPRVELGEAATQALGLTFHELATNALKYGDVGNGDGSLLVEWRVEGRAPKRQLVLIWTESSATPLEEPEKKGFGTRLIEANITRELGGAIKRVYGERSLVIEITLPLG